MPPTGTRSTRRARRAAATRSAKRPNTTRAATWVAPIRPAAMAAWRSVQPWSVRYGMRCTIAALIAPIDSVNATVRPSIAGSRDRRLPWRSGVGGLGRGRRRALTGACGRPGSTRAWMVIVTTPRPTAQIVERAAPAAGVLEGGDGRLEDRRGEPGDEGEGGDRPGGAAAELLDQHDLGRLVEHEAHGDPDQQPRPVEGGHGAGLRPGEHPDGRDHRAGGHQQAGRAPVEPAPDRERGEPGDDHGDRERPDERGAAPAEVALHRREQHGEAVEADPPRHRLGHRQAREQTPRAVTARRRSCAQLAQQPPPPDPERVPITTFCSCSVSPCLTYHSQRVPSGPWTQVSVFSA